MVYIIEQLY